ncbi:hypothetical protein [Aureimonas ureilytica]|uniref:hypothetical protein n=1 Tax=Aureimonas ureilytica TaxID=401562 RepID=UPI0003604BA6|nr:hypothetical protein [Aureimonas ureilytica]
MIQTQAPSSLALHPTTRTDTVRLEGRDAASRRLSRHDNPYRSSSADGVAWHEGYDSVAPHHWQRAS